MSTKTPRKPLTTIREVEVPVIQEVIKEVPDAEMEARIEARVLDHLTPLQERLDATEQRLGAQTEELSQCHERIGAEQGKSKELRELVATLKQHVDLTKQHMADLEAARIKDRKVARAMFTLMQQQVIHGSRSPEAWPENCLSLEERKLLVESDYNLAGLGGGSFGE